MACDGEKLKGVLQFAYLGNMLAGDAASGADVDYRVGKASGLFKIYRQVLTDSSLPLPLRLKLYKVGVCSSLTYSSANWNFGFKEKAKVNGVNAKWLSLICGITIEMAAKAPIYCLVSDIRRRRMIWLGHVLRYGEDRGTRRALLAYMHDKNGIYEPGTVLDKAPDHGVGEELLKLANGDGTKESKDERRTWWRNRVKRIITILRPRRPPKGA